MGGIYSQMCKRNALFWPQIPQRFQRKTSHINYLWIFDIYIWNLYNLKLFLFDDLDLKNSNHLVFFLHFCLNSAHVRQVSAPEGAGPELDGNRSNLLPQTYFLRRQQRPQRPRRGGAPPRSGKFLN